MYFQKIAQTLIELRPFIPNFPRQEGQVKMRKDCNRLIEEQIKQHKKAQDFLNKPLPNYSRQELNKILSEGEKELAKNLENSGICEASESYHQNNLFNKPK